ncbi:OsmC family protein [Plantibacter sp. VKM Ac-2885]|uniref:OsmC family protein n=1 Tax=Plantibacter TaxID=190323 RepID=UPI00188C1FD1|nr:MULTISPECIES: OsmC family protein [Plantibacter]MBF4512842.1 OsmC family protein [Plantibacter sp. VKM Ac-2885]CAH0226009.1 hypothetical protein SRABI02_02569 [Plantibacter cousiniae]
MTTHNYTATVTWSGRTDAYETYSRRHGVRLGDSSIDLSAAAEFRGDSGLPNPEQLLVAAASSCQLLSFLAVAAHAGVEIIDYRDAATGIMPDDTRPMRLTEIVLRPTIVAQGTTTGAVERLLEKAHRQCYIANSLTAVVTLEPEITVR